MSTKKWCALLCAVFLLMLALCFLPRGGEAGGTAVVRVNGQIVAEIDLSRPEKQEAAFEGCVIRAENGRVRVAEADCPDRICVRRGEIGVGDIPIACLPNRLTITVEGGAEPELDAISQ